MLSSRSNTHYPWLFEYEQLSTASKVKSAEEASKALKALFGE